MHVIMSHILIIIVFALVNASAKYMLEMYNKFTTGVYNIYKIHITNAYFFNIFTTYSALHYNMLIIQCI